MFADELVLPLLRVPGRHVSEQNLLLDRDGLGTGISIACQPERSRAIGAVAAYAVRFEDGKDMLAVAVARRDDVMSLGFSRGQGAAQ